jgi:hypothetical protein
MGKMNLGDLAWWENNIKTGLKERWFEFVDLIQMVQNRAQYQVLLNTIPGINVWVP